MVDVTYPRMSSTRAYEIADALAMAIDEAPQGTTRVSVVCWMDDDVDSEQTITTTLAFASELVDIVRDDYEGKKVACAYSGKNSVSVRIKVVIMR